MAFNPYRDFKPDPTIEFRPKGAEFYGPERNAAVAGLKSHMETISGDASGTPLDEQITNPDGTTFRYLSKEDTATLLKFKALADHLGWPTSDDMDMRNGRYGSVPPAWHNKRWPVLPDIFRNSQGRVAKAGLTKALFYPRIDDGHKGYIFGRLGIAEPAVLIALCDDGKLRAQRGRELQRSEGIGWGRLPDLDKLQPALKSGCNYGVDYTNANSKPFKQRLLSLIPAERRATVNLADFGLDK